MGLPRRPAANIESKSSAKSLKRSDSSTWKLCVCAESCRDSVALAPHSYLIIICRIIVYFQPNDTDFNESIICNLLFSVLSPSCI